MLKTRTVAAAGTVSLLCTFASATGCSSNAASSSKRSDAEHTPTCSNGLRDGNETGVDCGGSCGACTVSTSASKPPGKEPGGHEDDSEPAKPECGGDTGVKCAEGKSCKVDSDCEVACDYSGKCISAPSCKPHLGGDTCGFGEVGEAGARHESCCRTLVVNGFVDPSHPDKTVYLDKYEITAGRIRAFVEQLAEQNNGVPDVRKWILEHRPLIWDDSWNEFLPTGYEGGTKTIARRLLGDPRVEDGLAEFGPGVILPPESDQIKNLGIDYQFGPTLYVDLHGNNCGTFDGSWGFPTYWYPEDILARDGQLRRADGVGYAGERIAAKDLLDVKAINCITNAMLAAFCAWDGGQLATDAVLDYVTETPETLGNISGCGTQYDNHGELLANKFDNTIQTGGRCAPVALVNATFDAGDELPVPGSPLNIHNYYYPYLGDVTHDKAWQVSAPGRATLAADANYRQVDIVRLKPEDEGWADLNGNLNEAALDMSGATFTGKFALKYRGLGYGSSRSTLNTTLMKGENVIRIQRPEAKAAYSGGRCMRFR